MAPPQNPVRLSFDDYVLDVARRELWRGSEPIALEPQVFDLLVYLVQNPDRVVSKDELLRAVWDDRIVTDSAITNRINAARRAISDSGDAQRLIRTVPRNGYRFIGTVKENGAEPAKAAASPGRRLRRRIPRIFAAGVASALLGAVVAAFLLWPTAGPPWPLAVRSDPGQSPVTALVRDLHLISGLPLTALGSGADQLNLPVGLTEMAMDVPSGRNLLAASRGTAPVHPNKAAVGAQIEASGREAAQLVAPNVALTAPSARRLTVASLSGPVEPPYPRDPARSFERNPDAGRYRVEEDKFAEVPCAATHIDSSAGGKCLRNYRSLDCDKAIDVVVYTLAKLSIEASTLIFDPYKLTATGFPHRCYVAGHPGYDLQDFQDMNQVTRRGGNWHNFLGNGEDKSIEFTDGWHNCVAVHKAGPKWQGGYVYMLHASICRTDTAALRSEDVAYALGSLQVRQYDPTGNLRQASK